MREENKEVKVTEEKKDKKNNVIYIIVSVVLVVLALIGGYFLGNSLAGKQDNKNTNVNEEKESNSNEEEEIKLTLTKEELTKLIDNNFYYDFKGNDIITDGEFNNETKLRLAIDHYSKYLYSLSEKNYEKEIKYADTDKVLKDDKNFEYDEDAEWYVLKGTTEDEEITFSEEEVEYIPYDTVNKYYKELFNSDAPKINLLTYVENYYYSSKINGYLVIAPGMGTIFVPEPIYGVKDYRVENKQLVVSVYHTTYEWDTYNDKNDVQIVMDKNKKLKYKIVRSKEEKNMLAMKNDMLKNHTDIMDVYDFVFDIDGSNYYLKEIKKAK